MKYIRQSISIILILAVLFALTVTGVSAQTGTIYQSSTKETVTAGVTLENIVRFTHEGWLNINVMRVDLGNPHVKVDTLSNGDSLQKLTSTANLAKARGAVAAVNASFFNPTGGGNAYADGPIVQSGGLTQASSYYNKYAETMASFSIDNLNKVLYDYWKTDMNLYALDGHYMFISQYNKPSWQDYKDYTIWDNRWSKTSLGATEKYPDIVEMVIEEGRITEIREGQPAVSIPQNGYVVITRQEKANFVKSHFKVGEEVNLSVTTTPDWSKLKMSVTGGSILVKDGEIPKKFSHDTPSINKRHPRTIVGSTEDGKQLLLVTVDGRQDRSYGMTQTEAANLMLELGAHNALNLDGGGSTTMVARKTGTSQLQIKNRPSDGSARAVSTAIGIFSIAPVSALSGLIIDTEDANLFVNTSRAFTVRGYDRYFNPIEIRPEQVKWSVTGLQGTFTDNVFRPKSIGDGKITATVGNVKAELPISSLSAPVKLELSSNSLKLPVNDSKSLSVTGINRNGFRAKLNPEDVKWTLKGSIGSMQGNTFTASARGTGYIEAALGSTRAYCAVSVAADITSVKDIFEKTNGAFLSYPDTVKGKYVISKEQKHGGKMSGKLTYKYEASEETRAVYMVLAKNGLTLSPAASKIGLWVFNDHENSNWLRAEVVDKAGKKHLVEFSKGMDWTGWKHLEASLDGIKEPASLTRLYIAQVNPVADSGALYFDDLSVTESGYPEVDISKIPKDTKPVDDAMRSVPFKSSDKNFRFSVFGESHAAANTLEKSLTGKLTDKISKYLEAAAYVGAGPHDSVKSLKKPYVATSSEYKAVDIKNSRFIQLDMSKSGLRAGSTDQWLWFLNQLETAKGSNVFIFLSGSPDTFSDRLEASLFKDTLVNYKKKTKKNVWVFYKGDENASHMERGIKYISSAGFDVQGFDGKNAAAAKYVLVVVRGSTVTFEFKPIS